ncbi:ABC transporter permease [Nocardioides sp. CFH 31398]|uniref:ABC transporter permease n=1 Tax=Nocardioides sp. CFH 31398 TaxID=2919579 RepID=UPI001F0711F7|nr:ABC transporter permease [Nocardioides sp. CFH 31398]MCH1867940.1 ABC transporter permease [Nocardioides sp. CFH 31398]
MATTAPATGTRAPRTRVPSVTRRLISTELRLLLREPMTLTFVFVFPVVTMLIIGGAFGTEPDEAFPVNPSHWYVAAYLATVIGSTGLVMVPVHLAAYRERGVLRRFAAAGFPRWSFALSQLVVGAVTTLLGITTLLLVAEPVYGVPTVEDLPRTLAGIAAGMLLFLALGTLLGSLLPSARAAQAVGLMLFVPSFLLGGGGPPPAAMTDVLSSIAEWTPLSLVTDSIRDPWLGLGDGTSDLLTVCAMAVVALALSARRTSL